MAPPSALLTAAGLIAAASALNIQHPALKAPATETFPGAVPGHGFIAVPVTAPPKRDVSAIRKRDDDSVGDVSIQNNKGSLYYIKIGLGTPPQEVQVVVDTGSSELWVNPDCDTSSVAGTKIIDGQAVTYVDTIGTDPKQCRKRGRYESKSSNTYKNPGLKGTQIQYADYTTAQIQYAQDSLTIAGLEIKEQIFGVATKSNQTGIGIMGFGPPHWGFNVTEPYPMILANLAKQRVINSPAFSLDLRNYDEDEGAIIFGGVDRKKYRGEMVKIPFEQREHTFADGSKAMHYSYYLTVKSMKLTLPGSKETKTIDVGKNGFLTSLDCGSTNNILPKGMVKEVCDHLKGTYDPDSENCNLDCDLRDKAGGLTFGLNGKEITMPYSNLIDKYAPEGYLPRCTLSQSNNHNMDAGILGAPFLRSAYAVFDWANEELHIAESGDCGSNIVAIQAGPNGVPSGLSECDGGKPAAGGQTSDNDNPDKKDDDPNSSAFRSAVSIGLALGAAVVSGFVLL